jgi:hypothetical protein
VSPEARRLLSVLAALLFLAATPSRELLSAQEEDAGLAILISGPSPTRGIRLLPPNALSAFNAEYRLEEESIRVIFTRERILPPSGSKPFPDCREEGLHRLADEESLSFLFLEPQAGAYALFFSFPPEAKYACLFIQAFMERFRFLLNFTQMATDVPFPAVLNLGEK